MSLKTETLGSQKQLALLNDIDKLRSNGISQYVNLPQLIVCGDQSSGKSSVLEAISGLKFPTKDNLCTRFATEVILRHAPETRVAVKIVASPDRSKDEQTRLEDFRRDLLDLEDLEKLTEQAKSHMGVADGSSAFLTDVLRLEVSGPNQPHLTIVDLPGLIHSESSSQTALDIQIVQSMVHAYMKNQRSIILAVISAKNDYANQIVLSMARKIDSLGTRTMGIITKPDTLSTGSESELAYLNLARNLDVAFRLGWHVLKNRSYETRDTSSAQRDDAEQTFFGQGVWKDLPRQSVGIYALRDKLSQILLNHIRAELPSLVDDVKEKVEDCKSALEKLGPHRDSLEQQQLFLLKISQDFQAVSKIALDGSYGHAFFGDPRNSEGYTKRLRAVIQNLNQEFAEAVHLRGQKRRIMDQNKISKSLRGQNVISRADYINEIKDLLRITRGRELLGMFNPLIVSDLFFEQSQPWESLARQHLRKAWEATKSFLENLVSHLADERTSDSLLGHVIDAAMDNKFSKMNEKLSELLSPYQKGHPITYNHYFTETLQKVKEKRREAEIARRLQIFLGRGENAAMGNVNVNNARMPDLLSALAVSTEADMDRYACSEILDCMEAYYKVAMKTFVDNVAVFAVESCLLSDLGAVFTPSLVLQMDRQTISQIASESHFDRHLREQNQKRLLILQAGLDICNAHMERKSSNREKLSGTSYSRPTTPKKSPAADEAEYSMEEEARSPNPRSSLKYDADMYAKLEPSSPVGLPETINISSDLEIVPSSKELESLQLRAESPPTEVERADTELFGVAKPLDLLSQLQFRGDMASSSAPTPLTFEEAPLTLTPKAKVKKSSKAVKKVVT